MNRKEARELLMQMVFQMEAQADTGIPLMETLMRDRAIDETQKEYLYTSFRTIVEHKDEIDDIINKYSEKWTVKRMPKADLAVVRVAVGEALFSPDIPAAVAINEAVNLAKEYGSDSTPKFVNGLLGKIVKNG